MWKLVLSHVPVEGWVINSDVHGFPDGPSGARYLPAYDSKAVHSDRMSHGLAVLIDGGGFVNHIKLVQLLLREGMVSYDVKPLSLQFWLTLPST